jgi:addiction module RelE/StbE family toxin
MGYQAKLTPTAQKDLEEIRSYIAQDNSEAADKVLREIGERIEVILDFPLSGAVCRDFAPSDVREIVFSHYRIIYSVYPERQKIYVLRVWHGARGRPRLSRVKARK